MLAPVHSQGIQQHQRWQHSSCAPGGTNTNFTRTSPQRMRRADPCRNLCRSLRRRTRRGCEIGCSYFAAHKILSVGVIGLILTLGGFGWVGATIGYLDYWGQTSAKLTMAILQLITAMVLGGAGVCLLIAAAVLKWKAWRRRTRGSSQEDPPSYVFHNRGPSGFVGLARPNDNAIPGHCQPFPQEPMGMVCNNLSPYSQQSSSAAAAVVTDDILFFWNNNPGGQNSRLNIVPSPAAPPPFPMAGPPGAMVASAGGHAYTNSAYHHSDQVLAFYEDMLGGSRRRDQEVQCHLLLESMVMEVLGTPAGQTSGQEGRGTGEEDHQRDEGQAVVAETRF